MKARPPPLLLLPAPAPDPQGPQKGWRARGSVTGRAPEPEDTGRSGALSGPVLLCGSQAWPWASWGCGGGRGKAVFPCLSGAVQGCRVAGISRPHTPTM